MAEERENILNGLDGKLVRKIAEQARSIVDESQNVDTMGKINEKARSLASTTNREQLRKEMLNNGINTKTMRTEMKEQKKMMYKLYKNNNSSRKGIYITQSRQIRNRIVPLKDMQKYTERIFNIPDAIEMSCSRLALGPLTGKSIKAWYDPSITSVNKRATKIVGFKMGGGLLLIIDYEDLEEETFLAAERILE